MTISACVNTLWTVRQATPRATLDRELVAAHVRAILSPSAREASATATIAIDERDAKPSPSASRPSR